MPRRRRGSDREGFLLGLGLDSDGQTRVTRGENFVLLGGTQDTHARMQEKAIKMNELLKRRGKRLGDLSREEFSEIAEKLSLKGGERAGRTADREPSHPS